MLLPETSDASGSEIGCSLVVAEGPDGLEEPNSRGLRPGDFEGIFPIASDRIGK